MEFLIFWLALGTTICRCSYIAGKRPVWSLYHELMAAWSAGDRKEFALSVATLCVFVVLWPLTLYYYWCDKSDW